MTDLRETLRTTGEAISALSKDVPRIYVLKSRDVDDLEVISRKAGDLMAALFSAILNEAEAENEIESVRDWLSDFVEAPLNRKAEELAQDEPWGRSDYEEHSTLNKAQQGIA